jgi:hypothetical protein
MLQEKQKEEKQRGDFTKKYDIYRSYDREICRDNIKYSFVFKKYM